MQLKLKGLEKRREQKADNSYTSTGWRSWFRSSGLRLFLLFFLLSFAFWMLQSMQSNHIRRLTIPIGYEALQGAWVMQGELPKEISLEVEARGFDHLAYSLEGLDTLRLGVVQDNKGKSFLGIERASLERELKRRLTRQNGGKESSYRILALSHESILLPLYKSASRRLPIRLAQPLRLAQGFTAISKIFKPDSLQVFGEETLLAKHQSVPLVGLPQEPLKASGVYTLSPSLPQGLSSSPNAVEMHITIEELTEQVISSLAIEPVGVPEGSVLKLMPNTADLKITIPSSMYNKVSGASFRLQVNYSEIEQARLLGEAPEELTVTLVGRPDWLKNYSMTPAKVQYVITH